MSDRYTQFVNSSVGKQLTQTLGLPAPEQLRRHEPGQAVTQGPVLLGSAKGGELVGELTEVLKNVGADIRTDVDIDSPGGDAQTKFHALVFDATGIGDSTDLDALYDFFHPSFKNVMRSGRVIVLSRPPQAVDGERAATAQRALEGFVRSAGKELRGGATAQLLEVHPGAESGIEAAVRFLLSARSAYVSGQTITVGPALGDAPPTPEDWERPLTGKVAVVTGAARGIGASIAEVLSRDGAHVVCLDLPSMGDQLASVANRIGGSTLQLDITADDAPDKLVEHLRERHDGVDIVVHNAGVTRDKTIVGMKDAQWDMVLDINLSSTERINDRLLDAGLIDDGSRLVHVSSLNGIAGAKGQTNYATSKAGVIGLVESAAARVAEAGGTINAVAPGFIETDMTAAMPIVPREVGRRMNSLGQGGEPVDVAEAIAFFASPASAWINGNVLRVCGQSLLGA